MLPAADASVNYLGDNLIKHSFVLVVQKLNHVHSSSLGTQNIYCTYENK